MKELLLQYARYNVWANKLVIDAMLAMPEAAMTQEINSSFKTIRETLLHTWSAESIWLQRMERVPREQQVWHMGSFTGSFAEACAGWERSSATVVEFVAARSEESLKEVLPYTDRSGNSHSSAIWQILHHVFNHSTYHRGQLITMLRQAGATSIPSTDFIAYVRHLG